MTARTIITATAAVALAAGPVGGQDKDVVQWYEWQTGRVWDGSGWVEIETVDQALELLATALNVNVATGPARDIMAGDLLDLTEAERNDLADRLGEMILADTTEGERVTEHASGTLREASEIHGHAHSFDVLVRTYERAVALGLHDRVHLGYIESADPVRGRAYVLGVFEARGGSAGLFPRRLAPRGGRHAPGLHVEPVQHDVLQGRVGPVQGTCPQAVEGPGDHPLRGRAAECLRGRRAGAERGPVVGSLLGDVARRSQIGLSVATRCDLVRLEGLRSRLGDELQDAKNPHEP